ncbi:MAG: peptidoglycan DD-metalloendopeptidase family protein [Candidatus Paceibacterota bacterium]|jgi:murein DD-endopeptidase MepM/ murein hydrolase activator NlpD
MSVRSFLSSLFIISIILLQSFTPVISSYAETAAELQSNLNSLSAQIDALDKEIKEFNSKIDKTQGEQKTLKQALANLELRRTALTKQINLTRLRIIEAQKNITETQGKISVTETVLEKNKNALSETLRSLVQNEQTLPPFVNALSSGSHLSDVVDVIKRGEDVSKAINEKVRSLVDAKTTLSVQKATFESNKQKLENLNSNLSDQKSLAEVTAKEKSHLLVVTKNKETEYQKLLADRQKKKDALELEMLDVESKLKVIVDSTKLPKYGRGVLQYPVSNINITQYFGNTPFASKNPQVYNGSGHNGIDFGVKIGTPIYAAESGLVLGVGNTDASCSGVSYGKWVLIRHVNGLTTLYAHLSVIQVEPGQMVASRQKIALSGNTGYSTGPHLHFTVYASDSVHISGPTEYKSKVCGTYLIMPLAPRAGYLNPLSYL